MSIPIALTIAGSDSSGGAGIQADLKSFAACGVYGASAITALTAQNTRGVTGVHPVPPAFVTAQIDAVFDDLDIRAIKVGMVAEAELIDAVAASLTRYKGPPVLVDPVMVASSGARLLAADAIRAMRESLIPRADLITPNLPEAAALLEEEVARSEDAAAQQGRRLLAIGCRAVLVKGGHAEGPESVDILVTPNGTQRFSAPRVVTRNTHGTGCSLSAAIAAYLARGHDLIAAIDAAKAFVTGAIAAADQLQVGTGHGPIHHFHALR